jgi:hypothetical protein
MATTKPLVNYFNRDFETLKADLSNYVKNYHSDKFRNFNDASPDMMYLEMLAYVGDSLNYSLDKAFNEAFRGTAQSRESLIRIAQDLGYYNFSPKPSTTQIVLQINVPAIPNSDGTALIPDPQYLFGIYSGMVVQSQNDTTFECMDEINFAQSFNRRIIPNLDSNGRLIDFTVEKSAIVHAGETRVQRYYVSQATAKPFLEIVLDDAEVTEVLGVLAVTGNVFDLPSEEEFRSSENLFVQVDNLSEDKVFAEINPMPVDLQNMINAYTDMTVNYGEWVNKPKRFVVRRDKNNRTSLVFGSTLVDFTTWNQVIGSYDASQLANFSLNQILNNMALGEVPPINSTLFIKFRTGAGTKTNVITNTIDTVIDKQIFLPATPGNLTVLDQVRNSLRVISNLPAVGGTNALSNEELRQSVGKVFSTNDRAVTYEDVKEIIKKMPIRYGQPFRVSYEEIKPKLLNYTQVKSYIETKLDELLNESSTVNRESKAQEIKDWITAYPNQIASVNSQNGQVVTLATASGAVNSEVNFNEHQLWHGEKCRLYILGLDSDFQPTTMYKDTNGLWKSPNTLLKNNIRNYLKEKRVIGDWIDIVDANVVNFQVEFRIIADKKNKQQVLINCLTRLREYFYVYNWQINQPIFKANISSVLQEIEGVINVVSVNFYNIWGTDLETGKTYSPVEIGRYKYLKAIATNSQNNRFEIQDFDNVIQSFPNTFLHCKYPEVDIKGIVIN